MSANTEIRAYHRDESGLLEIATVYRWQGRLYTTGSPADPQLELLRTGETTELAGWPDEGQAAVWADGYGREIVVPEAG